MSIWTSKPAWAGVLSLALLSGCLDGGGGDVSANRPGVLFSRAAPEKMAVAGGDVIVAGPQGFCVDKPASRSSDAHAFVLLASCAAITKDGNAPRPRVQALLTASVTGDAPEGPSLAEQAESMRAFFGSEAGRAALARDGRADSVRIIDMFAHDGAFLIHASDTSEDISPGLNAEYWRAIFDVNGRLVSASVVAFDDRPFSDEAGQRMLARFAARIRHESSTVARSLATQTGARPQPRPSRSAT